MVRHSNRKPSVDFSRRADNRATCFVAEVAASPCGNPPCPVGRLARASAPLLMRDHVTAARQIDQQPRSSVREKNKQTQPNANREECKPNSFFECIPIPPFRYDLNYIINTNSQSDEREKFHRIFNSPYSSARGIPTAEYSTSRPCLRAPVSLLRAPFRNWLSGMQLPEQLLSLFQIQRVKAFGEPAVNRSEKIAGLIPLEQVRCMPPMHAGYPSAQTHPLARPSLHSQPSSALGG